MDPQWKPWSHSDPYSPEPDAGKGKGGDVKKRRSSVESNDDDPQMEAETEPASASTSAPPVNVMPMTTTMPMNVKLANVGNSPMKVPVARPVHDAEVQTESEAAPSTEAADDVSTGPNEWVGMVSPFSPKRRLPE